MNITNSNFYSLRKKVNCKQSNIAKDLKISQPLISQWETGKRQPPVDILPKLAKILHCSIEELVYSIIETKKVNDLQKAKRG